MLGSELVDQTEAEYERYQSSPLLLGSPPSRPDKPFFGNIFCRISNICFTCFLIYKGRLTYASVENCSSFGV